MLEKINQMFPVKEEGYLANKLNQVGVSSAVYDLRYSRLNDEDFYAKLRNGACVIDRWMEKNTTYIAVAYENNGDHTYTVVYRITFKEWEIYEFVEELTGLLPHQAVKALMNYELEGDIDHYTSKDNKKIAWYYGIEKYLKRFFDKTNLKLNIHSSLYNNTYNQKRPYYDLNSYKIQLITEEGDYEILDLSDMPVIIMYEDYLVAFDTIDIATDTVIDYLEGRYVSNIYRDVLISKRTKSFYNTFTNQIVLKIDNVQLRQFQMRSKLAFARLIPMKSSMAYIYIKAGSISDIRPCTIQDNAENFLASAPDFSLRIEEYKKEKAFRITE